MLQSTLGALAANQGTLEAALQDLSASSSPEEVARQVRRRVRGGGHGTGARVLARAFGGAQWTWVWCSVVTGVTARSFGCIYYTIITICVFARRPLQISGLVAMMVPGSNGNELDDLPALVGAAAPLPLVAVRASVPV